MEKQDIMDSEERIEEFVTAPEKMLAEVLSEVNQDQEELKAEGSNGEAKDGKVTVSEDSNNEETQTQVPPENMEETNINPEQEVVEEETKVKFVVKGSLGGEAPKPKVCTLDEEPENPTNERNDLSNASWREDSINDDFDEDEEDYSDEDDEYYSDEDDEDEEAAAEWLRRYYLRQRGLPEALASLPSTIKVSLVSETEEDRLRREEREREQIAKRREAYRKQMAENVAKSLEKGKRKFGDRMNLEEASRDDFDNGQDYVDFLNSKLQNVSIKMTR